MRGFTVALIVVTGLSLAGCTRRHSLFMDPGKPEQTKPGHGHDLRAPAPRNERQ